ncbi:hypothetical protein scyTo_0012290 [Scyliorhinus torazame]|uniref:pre-mRNA 3' end processing protein WDR33 n=1 Tax=Scyliorhinus torazame TaxID=75743 RepID=A0A401P5V6_SCYTO|nr:hypothetical protein [Scyliorhinus torazame]
MGAQYRFYNTGLSDADSPSVYSGQVRCGELLPQAHRRLLGMLFVHLGGLTNLLLFYSDGGDLTKDDRLGAWIPTSSVKWLLVIQAQYCQLEKSNQHCQICHKNFIIMALEITSPPRFFHMPRFQHQGPRHTFYKRPDFAQQQAMQQLTFDGKRMRKAVNRKTIDYNPSVIKFLENRVWQRDHRDLRAIQPDSAYYNDLVPPMGMLQNPMNAVTTKFVRTSTNKVKCPVFVVRWTPEGRRLVTGASSGEFTLWNGLTFNFETILQAHDSPVRAMTWSHNDMWMLTADHGGYVKYWQSNMNNVKMFQAHKEAIREASFSPTDNKFATCSDDGTVRIWDFLRCHEERILRGHGADVKCVDWHPTKGLVVSGSKDSQQPIKFWDPKTGQSLATLHAHKNTVMEVKWNQNGNWLLTASRDHLCKMFDIRNLKEELQVFRGHKKEATAVAWHPVHEGLFASGGSDGSLLFWHVGVEKEVGGMEMAHEGMIWSLAWHPLGHILCSGSNDHTSKFWTRNRPGDKMRDRYNLNLLPGMSDEAVGEYDDIEPNSLSSIPGMGIPEQLKQALELEQANKEEANEVEMAIPGLDWGMDEMMLKDQKKVIQKKVPYAKPIPMQFQQAWSQNKVLTIPVEEPKIERTEEKKQDEKKKSQAEIEQEMAALQYTNPLLLEQLKIERMAQKQAEQQPAKPSLLGDGPRMPFNQAPNQVPPLMMVPQGPVRLPASNQGPPGPGPSKGESHGPPNHHMGHPQEMRRDQSAERDPERGPPYRGSHDWGDPRENRGSAERRGPPQDYHDRFEGPDQYHEDYRKDERYSHRSREFENRMGPPPVDEGWRRGPGPQRDFPPDQEYRDFGDPEHRGPNRGPPQGWDGRKPLDERFMREPDDMRFRGRRDDRFRPVRGGSRHDGRGPRGREAFGNMDEFMGDEDFDQSEENARGREPGGRGRGRGAMRGGRGGLLPLPGHDEFPRFEGGRKSEKRPLSPGGHRDGWGGRGDRGEIHDASREQGVAGRSHYADDSRQNHSPHDGQSPVNRERRTSLHSMDTASRPPHKRPWYEGPGTPDQRDFDAPGPPAEDRGPSRSGPASSPRVPKSGRSNSHEGDRHEGFHRDDGFSSPAGPPPRGGARGGPNWGRSGKSSGGPRRGSSRGSRGR